MSPTVAKSRSARSSPRQGDATERADAYADPRLYDLLHTPGTAEELDALERIAARFVGSNPRGLRWLEPCCGTGRFLRLLARRGVRCAGVELSREIALFANERLTDADLHGRARAVAGDIRRLTELVYPRGLGPPFDFAFVPHNSIRHLPTPRDLTEHLRSLAGVLSPRGVYAVGIGLQPLTEPIVGEDVHTARRGRAKVSAVFEYFEAPRTSAAGPRHERVLSFTTRTVGRRSRTIESSYDLLCVDPAMWRRCVARAGLVELAVVDDERARELPADRVDYAYRVLGLSRAAGRSRA